MCKRFYSEIKLDTKAKHSFDSEKDFAEYTQRRLVKGFSETIISKAQHTVKMIAEQDMEAHRLEVVILSLEEYSELLLYKTIFESLNVNHQSLIDYFKEEKHDNQ